MVSWILVGVIFIVLVALYRRGVKERNHLAVYAGMLLLSDEAREVQKKQLEGWIQRNTAANALSLSTSAMLTIQRIANAAAAGGAVLMFNSLVWDRKKELESGR